MARPKISPEQKKAEGEKLRAYFEQAQAREPELTQDSLAGELGVSQGLIGQWFTGKTAIADRRLLWLGARLGFNPVEFRPSVEWAVKPSGSTGSPRLSEVIQQIPPEEQDYIAEILAPIVEALTKRPR